MSVMMHQMNRAPRYGRGVDDPAGLSHGLASRATPRRGTDAGHAFLFQHARAFATEVTNFLAAA